MLLNNKLEYYFCIFTQSFADNRQLFLPSLESLFYNKTIFLFLIQVSRSIGDAYLKNAKFNREPLASRFQLAEPFHQPILIAGPTVSVHKLHPHDLFLIFADGLWGHLSNQEAVDIVHKSPCNVRFIIIGYVSVLVLKHVKIVSIVLTHRLELLIRVKF